MMLLGTKGQQFTAQELVGLLEDAGFRHAGVVPARGNCAIVSAVK